jgi:acyl-coenzyme A thioesterase PaaI-like protein
MVRPVPLEQEMTAVGKVIDRTRTMAISEATLTNKDGKIYATATATCRILAPS